MRAVGRVHTMCMNPSAFPVSWHPAHPNGYGSRQGYAPEAIVLHGTAGSAVAALSWFANSEAHVAAHYVVAADGTVYQCVSVQNAAYANGILEEGWGNAPMAPLFRGDNAGVNPNFITIAIEHERTTDQMMSGEPMPPAQFEASCELVAWLWQTVILPGGATGLALDRAHIGKHADISPSSRVYCPGWSEDEQARYVSRVAVLVSAGVPVQPPVPIQPSTPPTSGGDGAGAVTPADVTSASAGVPDPLVLQLVKLSLDALGSAIGLMQSNTPEARGFAVQTLKAEAGALPE